MSCLGGYEVMLLSPNTFEHISFLCSGTSPPSENSPPQAGALELTFPAFRATRSQACQRHPYPGAGMQVMVSRASLAGRAAGPSPAAVIGVSVLEQAYRERQAPL